MPMNIHFLISCEHGGNRIPPRYRPLFEGYEHLLHSHRGYDSGALGLAKKLAMALHSPLFAATTSRLLIDLNRSIGHPQLYSEATRNTPGAVRQEILKNHYLPYRTWVEANIADAIRSGLRVIHISSHSFTPELNGEVRNTDIGLLYDPSRHLEQELCTRWRACLAAHVPDLRVRRNYPYTGSVNGFPTYLRRRFPANAYVGIELEVNQKHILKGGWRWHALRSLLAGTLNEAVA
ncbi:Predicted N-formylglutamate amidohydrolase [Nitrosospira multiformis]|uniref:Predicted N-formylglutamate amidohydrolase n=2 Tax=Nitrosospira multiformis TaxID=1231 RepID=A0A1H8G2J9_9PROT|nr:Predicted N-formylglutamate amidohydrolase [Nitrosospira multiformis]